jgi:ATP-dependent Lon protease
MATALASAFTNTPVRHDIAMTGEVTLRGRVLQIGGLKEKILAAKRVGIFTVILPKKNEKDLADIPKHLLKGMTFIFAETMDEVLGAALRRVPARRGAHAKSAVPARRSTMSRRPVAAAPSKRH